MFFTEVLKSVFCWNVSFSNIFIRFIVVLISKAGILVLTGHFFTGGDMMSRTELDRNLLLTESSVDLIEGAGLLEGVKLLTGGPVGLIHEAGQVGSLLLSGGPGGLLCDAGH